MNKKIKKEKSTLLPSFTEIRNILATFIVVMLTNILFRADSIAHAWDYFTHIFSLSFFTIPVLINKAGTVILFSGFMFLVEWLGREREYALAGLGLKFPKPLRWAFYYCIAMIIFLFAGKEQQFIYFQF